MCRVSVLIATFNMENYVCEAIDSSLNSLDDCEVVIVDDGSTDRTFELLKEKYINEDRVVLHKFDQNRGKVAAFNMAYFLSKGEVLTLLGADDHMLPGRQAAVDYMLENERVDLVLGSYFKADKYMNNKKRMIIKSREWSQILQKNSYPGGAMVIKRNLAECVFPIPESLKNEDYLIALCASQQKKVKIIDKDVLVYRRHEGNTWSSLSESNALKNNALRGAMILDYFKVGHFSGNQKDHDLLNLAIEVKNRTASKPRLSNFFILIQMFRAKYPISIMLRVLLGCSLYVKLKNVLSV